jgi:hypothetical protein
MKIQLTKGSQSYFGKFIELERGGNLDNYILNLSIYDFDIHEDFANSHRPTCKFYLDLQFLPKKYYNFKSYLLTIIKGKYLRWTNKTQKEALRYLERCEPVDMKERHTIICTEPECTFSTIYRDTYERHISEVHGYPADMVVSAYMTEAKVEPATGYIKKANPEYLKHL